MHRKCLPFLRITVSRLVRSKLVGEQVVLITLAYVPLDLILPDQPNRAVRTRMLRGVGGALCEGVSLSRYPSSGSYHVGYW
jgi:hypothetical protein